MDSDLESILRHNFVLNSLTDLDQTAYSRRVPWAVEGNRLYGMVRGSNLLEPVYFAVQFGIDAGIRALPKEWRWVGYFLFAADRFQVVARNQNGLRFGAPTVSFYHRF